jgi:CubicO group peptidase (beta-lactamase class C family)
MLASEISPAKERDPGHIAAGYKAGFMCSGVFTAGRDREDVRREELKGGDPTVFLVPGALVDYENRAVYAPYSPFRPPRLAVEHDGFGCVLMPVGATLDDVDMLPEVEMPASPGDPATIPWPDGDLVPEAPLPPEVDKKKLDKAVELAFSGSKYKPHHTLGVVVVYKGKIIAERYTPGWGVHTQYRTWSTAKSLINALVGIMVHDGKMRVTDPVPIPEWQNDPRKEITIENLLQMSSGLKSVGSLTRRGYWGGINVADDLVDSQLEAEPGTRWKYSNYDMLLLVLSLRNILDDDEDYWTFPYRELFNKIGMRHTIPGIDPFGNYILSSQVYTTPRDLARFGMLYLNDGLWNKERILPEGWVEYSTTPAPAKSDKVFGAPFWLIGIDPRIPDDTFTTDGARGQYSTIVPSRDLVVVRTGLDPLVGSRWSQEEFVSDILGAIMADERP